MNTVNKHLIAFLIALVAVKAFAAALPVRPTFERVDVPITVTIHTFETQEDLATEYHNLTGRDLGDRKRQAFAQWNEAAWNADREVSEYKCEVWIVRPKSESSKSVKSLGHEMLHCIYGEWHGRDY